MPAFCQISACGFTGELVDEYYGVYIEPYMDRLDQSGRKNAFKVDKALDLLLSEDEKEGHRAMSIVGAFHDHEDEPLWEAGACPDSLEQLLKEAEGHVRVLSGWLPSGGNYFEDPRNNRNRVRVSYGSCFIVQTYMLPILEAATNGRVSPQRLWQLGMAKRHLLLLYGVYVLPGVDYGPIRKGLNEHPWYLGDVRYDELHTLGWIGTPEEIAEVLRKRGFWMWMRPDRFPVDPSPTSESGLDIPPPSVDSALHHPISKLPLEILQSIILYLPLSSIVALSMLDRGLYYQLLGSEGARNATAKVYMRTQARWCLPYGEAELKWWNDRNGDDALGWSYLKRCLTESHSMKNRRRVWKAAQSIERECELEEAKRSRA